MSDNLVHKDLWLSEILGKEAFHLKAGAALQADFQQGCFVDAKINVADVAGAYLLEERGFRLTDTNVQLKRNPAPFSKNGTGIRFAKPSDEAVVRRIAGSTFTKSRFHLDPLITSAQANRIKSEWAGNYFNNTRGNWMVVAEDEGEVCGFLQLLKRSESEIIIDLIAVHESSQGKGFAAAMISFAYDNCSGQPSIIVGTQVSNTRSLGFYESLGFRALSAQYVFHLHL